jgi:hypothetical protein
MKNMLALLSATTVLTLGAGAYAADTAEGKAKVEYKANGGYEAKQSGERTLDDGTKVKSETNVDVDVDHDGTVDRTVKSEETSDPKGLMNKQSDNTKTKFDEKSDGGYTQTSDRKHKDANGTNIMEKSKTDVDVDRNGNVTQTTKNEKTTDPKGLFNKKTTKEKTKMVNGQVVEDKKND